LSGWGRGIEEIRKEKERVRGYKKGLLGKGEKVPKRIKIAGPLFGFLFFFSKPSANSRGPEGPRALRPSLPGSKPEAPPLADRVGGIGGGEEESK
jgi:hypothetical protein